MVLCCLAVQGPSRRVKCHIWTPSVKDVPSHKDEDMTAANHPFMSGTFGVRLTREVAHANIVVYLCSF